MIKPKMVKLAADMNEGLMIVELICMRKGSNRGGFLELHSRPECPIHSPKQPMTMAGIIHHVRHLIASPRWRAAERAKKVMKMMATDSVGT